MSRHSAPPVERDYGTMLAVVMLLIASLVAISVAKVESDRQAKPVGIPTDTSITAEATTISYEAPQVTTTAAPPAPVSAPPPTYPIPPCAQDNVGPGVAPCHWDSGQYGGSQSYVWTGEYKITLIEPRP